MRKSSGFIAHFKFADVFLFNVSAFSLGVGIAILPYQFAILAPGARLWQMLGLGAVVSLFNGLTYGLFAAAIPESGGDFRFITRTFSPFVGFVASFGFTVSQFMGIGVYSTMAITDTLCPALAVLGVQNNNPSLITLSRTLAEPMWLALGSTILLGLIVATSLRGLKTVTRVLRSLFLLGFFGFLLMTFTFAHNTPSTWEHQLNAYLAPTLGPDPLQALVAQAASQPPLSGSHSGLPPWLLSLPVGYLFFFGFTFSSYLGGEVQRPRNTQTLGMLAALAVGVVSFWVCLHYYYNLVGTKFSSAVATLAYHGKGPLPPGGIPLFVAGLLTDGHVYTVIVVGSFVWFFLLLLAMLQVCVRNIWAYSFAKLMFYPERLTSVSETSHSPTVAIVVTGLGAWLFVLLRAFLGLNLGFYVCLFSVCYLIAGLAGLFFPIRDAKTFAKCSAVPLVPKYVFGVPTISIAGAITAIAMGLVLYATFTSPDFGGAQTSWQIALAAVVYSAGVGLYWYFTYMKRSFDPHIMFEEIPIEED
jgi:amino acid transporter